MGVNPQLATSAAWILGGATAAIAGILLAAVTTLHPVVLSLQAVPALVAALIGGMGSLPGALVGAAAVGGVLGLVPAVPSLQKVEGSAQLLLTLLALAVMAMRGERYVATNVRSGVATGATKSSRRAGLRTRQIVTVFFVVAAFPWLPFVSFSVLGSANLAAYYALVALSLVVLVGWVGQISLGHAGLVGSGAYVTGLIVTHWKLTFPVSLLWAAAAGAVIAAVLGAVAVRVRGLYLAVATLIFSWMAVEFLFRQKWFTTSAANSIDVKAFGEEGTFPYLDWTSRRTFFYAAWAVVAAVAYLMANLRDSKTGRAFFAVRGSEVAAASLGISVLRTKLLAFAVSGAVAGMAGNILLIRDQTVSPDAFRVEVSLFFLAVAVVGGLSSLGGAVAAALLFAALNELFFRLEVLSGWLEVVPPLLLTTVLLAYRGGLAAIPGALQKRFGSQIDTVLVKAKPFAGSAAHRLEPVANLGRAARRRTFDLVASVRQRLVQVPGPDAEPFRGPAKLLARFTQGHAKAIVPEPRLDLRSVLQPAHATGTDTATGTSSDGSAVDSATAPSPPLSWRSVDLKRPALPPDRDDRRRIIDVSGVTVRFGGLVAVNDLSMSVREGEIVGLIGPNGAGKTTTFNAIAGLNVPAAGTVHIFGRDVTRWTVDERARLGVGRTFQAIQLVPELTVFDNLLVATHVHNPSNLLSHLFVGPATLAAEREGRRQVADVATLLELEEHLDRVVADLPFGVLRMVEVARALVTGARLIMLDEPASGLDSGETDRLAEILGFVRDLGVTLLLIEHDVKMVTSVSDYMYVLDYGALLAEGTPAMIQRDPRVIAAYLGGGPSEDAAFAEAVV